MNYVVLICAPALSKSLFQYVEQLLQNSISHVVIHYAGRKEADIKNTAQCTWLHGTKEYLREDEQLKEGLIYCLQNFSDIHGIVTTYDADYQISDVLKVGKSLQIYPNHFILGVSRTAYARINRFLWKPMFKLIYGEGLQDIQTRLRAIPFSKIKQFIQMKQIGVEYKLNMLIGALQSHMPIQEVPIVTESAKQPNTTFWEKLRFGFTMLKGAITYALSTIGAGIIDVIAFYLLYHFIFQSLSFGSNLFLATITARILSSIFNYWINRKFVFYHKETPTGSFVKYYTLWLTLIFLSYILMYITMPILTFIPIVLLKLIIDALLGLFSYQVQLHWVFKKNVANKKG